MSAESPAESSPDNTAVGSDVVATPEVVFDVRGLEVAYSGRPALRSIDLRIPRRGITAIVGPSGCGKSTFLSSLNRLTDLVPGCRVRGSIRFDGHDIHAPECDVLQLRRRVGMVFQSPVPFPLSIRRNLLLPLREHGWAREQADARAEQSLRDVGLWDEVHDRLDAPAPTLSGGQQQRLCIARALALQPEVMLFDEPCSSLDPLASGVVEDCITSLSQHVAVVIVTHNLAQARRIANHVAVFWHQDGAGTVIDSGPARRVFESPASETAAAYLNGTRG